MHSLTLNHLANELLQMATVLHSLTNGQCNDYEFNSQQVLAFQLPSHNIKGIFKDILEGCKQGGLGRLKPLPPPQVLSSSYYVYKQSPQKTSKL